MPPLVGDVAEFDEPTGPRGRRVRAGPEAGLPLHGHHRRLPEDRGGDGGGLHVSRRPAGRLEARSVRPLPGVVRPGLDPRADADRARDVRRPVLPPGPAADWVTPGPVVRRADRRPPAPRPPAAYAEAAAACSSRRATPPLPRTAPPGTGVVPRRSAGQDRPRYLRGWPRSRRDGVPPPRTPVRRPSPDRRRRHGRTHRSAPCWTGDRVPDRGSGRRRPGVRRPRARTSPGSPLADHRPSGGPPASRIPAWPRRSDATPRSSVRQPDSGPPRRTSSPPPTWRTPVTPPPRRTE